MNSSLPTPQGMAYVWWHFERALVENLFFDIEIRSGEERFPGRYFQLYQGRIGSVRLYFGFQTDLYKPDSCGQGKGLLFSRWGTKDPHDGEPPESGWLENSHHEGDFVGVRSPFNWTLGRYQCWLQPTHDDHVGRWYEFRVQRMSDQLEGSAGALRFPMRYNEPPLIHSGGGTWTEVYRLDGQSIIPEDVPLTHLVIHRVLANGCSVAPRNCEPTYNPAFLPAVCSFADDRTVHLRSGHGVVRSHPG